MQLCWQAVSCDVSHEDAGSWGWSVGSWCLTRSCAWSTEWWLHGSPCRVAAVGWFGDSQMWNHPGWSWAAEGSLKLLRVLQDSGMVTGVHMSVTHKLFTLMAGGVQNLGFCSLGGGCGGLSLLGTEWLCSWVSVFDIKNFIFAGCRSTFEALFAF